MTQTCVGTWVRSVPAHIINVCYPQGVDNGQLSTVKFCKAVTFHAFSAKIRQIECMVRRRTVVGRLSMRSQTQHADSARRIVAYVQDSLIFTVSLVQYS